jgi:hypothetical protein
MEAQERCMSVIGCFRGQKGAQDSVLLEDRQAIMKNKGIAS